jgi:phage I-like protein
MNALILNRDFQHPSDGWYMIEPLGETPNPDHKLVQVIDAAAAGSITNRFNSEADKPGFAGMLVDHEHFKHDIEKETIAYGWLMRLENRADGIYGQVRWTTTGKAAVDGGDYRFFSTEYDSSDLKILNSGNVKRIRPLRLDGLTLTNNPRSKSPNGMPRARPITNRNDGNDFRPGTVPAADEPTKQGQHMKSVCTRLGLSADASEDAVLAEVNKLFNRVDASEKEATPLKNRIADLEKENKTMLTNRVESDLEAYKDCYEEKDKDAVKADLILNRDLTVRGFERVRSVKGQKTQQRGSVVLNRHEGRASGRGGESAPQTGTVTPDQLRSEVRKLMNRDGIKDFTVGFNALREEKPELFAGAQS